MPATTYPALPGETLAVPERVVVAPAVGVFRTVAVREGAIVEPGDELGAVVGPGARTAVRSPFRGTLMGMLAHEGERVRQGQPIAWLRVA